MLHVKPRTFVATRVAAKLLGVYLLVEGVLYHLASLVLEVMPIMQGGAGTMPGNTLWTVAFVTRTVLLVAVGVVLLFGSDRMIATLLFLRVGSPDDGDGDSPSQLTDETYLRGLAAIVTMACTVAALFLIISGVPRVLFALADHQFNLEFAMDTSFEPLVRGVLELLAAAILLVAPRKWPRVTAWAAPGLPYAGEQDPSHPEREGDGDVTGADEEPPAAGEGASAVDDSTVDR